MQHSEDAINSAKNCKQSNLSKSDVKQNNMDTNNSFLVSAHTLPFGVVQYNFTQNFLMLNANKEFYDLIGYSEKEFKDLFNNDIELIAYFDDVKQVKKIKNNTNGDTLNVSLRIIDNNKNIKWILVKGELLPFDGKKIYQCIFINITDLKSINEQLAYERERYLISSNFCEDIIFEYDIENKKYISYFDKNKNYIEKEYIENFRENVISQNLIYEDDISLFNLACSYMETGTEKFNVDFRSKLRSELFEWTTFQGKTIFNESKPTKVMGKISNTNDIKRKTLEAQLRIENDDLTGLYKKDTAEYLVNNILKEKNVKIYSAFILINIIDFKSINNNFGKLMGDDVLKKVAQRIMALFRDADILSRICSDEFSILMKNIPGYKAATSRCQEIFSCLKSIYVNKEYFDLYANIGISIFPCDGLTYNELYVNAYKALMQSKKRGKDQYEVYTFDTKCKNPSTKVIKQEEETDNIRFNIDQYSFSIMDDIRDSESAIIMFLSKIVKDFNFGRVCIWEIDYDNENLKITYEWCNKNVESLKNKNYKIPLTVWDKFTDKFCKNGIYACADCDSLSILSNIKDYIGNFDAKSEVISLIYYNNKKIGFMSYELFSKNPHKWSYDELVTINALTKTIGSYFTSMRTKQSLEPCNHGETKIFEGNELLTFIFEFDTYKLLYMSPNIKHKFPNAQLGKSCYEIFKNRNIACGNCPLKRGTSGAVEGYNKTLDLWINETVSIVELNNGEKAVLASIADITEFRKKFVSTDILTGLSTITQFQDDIQNVLMENCDTKYAIVYSDFDKFKYINDVSGYEVGNQVLVSFASLMHSEIYDGEYLCRYSADIFIYLLKYENEFKLRERLNGIKSDIEQWSANKFSGINISVISGIYMINKNDKDISAMIDRANTARKSIKGLHSTEYAFYDENLHLKFSREKEIELIMDEALKGGEFKIYLQPKISLDNGKIIGAESLVRWCRPDGQIIMPSEFISLFERNGFIKKMDYYLFEQIFKLVRNWIDNKKTLVPVSINVSRSYIRENSFIDYVKSLLDKYEIPAYFIELELTESIFISETDQLVEIINKLKKFGISFSIDDFGSGYSSLNLLRFLPIDVLKLDKDFFNSSFITSKEKSVLAHIIHMAKDIDMKVLSEGVETKEQEKFLKEVGCDLAQGYLYSKPITVKEFEKIVTENKSYI